MLINKQILNKINRINLRELLLGGLQMNNYKIPDSITKKVQGINSEVKNNKKLQDVYDKLDQVTNKYSGSKSNSVPEKITLEKMEFSKPTSEDIVKSSETKLAEYKNNNIKNINDEFKLKEDELYLNKTSLLNQTENTKNNLNDYYNNAIQNAENQALKRGLSRSSIIVNQLDAFEHEKLNDYKQLDKELSNQINAINFELNALNSQKQAALNNFDITYAVKLQDEINSLTEKLNSKESEVIKYNNEIALKEAEFNKDVDELKNELENSKWNDTTDLINIYGKYGSNIVEKVKNDEVYKTAKQLLTNLTSDEIQLILNDEGFKTRLGKNYEKLLEEFA